MKCPEEASFPRVLTGQATSEELCSVGFWSAHKREDLGDTKAKVLKIVSFKQWSKAEWMVSLERRTGEVRIGRGKQMAWSLSCL